MSFAITDEKYDEIKAMEGTIELTEYSLLAQGQVFYKKSWNDAKKIAADGNEPTNP